MPFVSRYYRVAPVRRIRVWEVRRLGGLDFALHCGCAARSDRTSAGRKSVVMGLESADDPAEPQSSSSWPERICLATGTAEAGGPNAIAVWWTMFGNCGIFRRAGLRQTVSILVLTKAPVITNQHGRGVSLTRSRSCSAIGDDPIPSRSSSANLGRLNSRILGRDRRSSLHTCARNQKQQRHHRDNRKLNVRPSSKGPTRGRA